MFVLVMVVASLLLAFRLWNILDVTDGKSKDLSNGSQPGIVHMWHHIIDEYGLPFGHVCVSFLYYIYIHLTVYNVTVFFFKFVTTGVYMYKFLKNIYITSRERIKQKQIELEDIQLQIEIVNTKLCVRDAEFTERAEQFRRDAERLRRARARVRDIIAEDETLRRVLERSVVLERDQDVNLHTTPEQDREFIVELLKCLKYDNAAIPVHNEKLECGENGQAEPSAADSVYSSISDIDGKQDCHVKIVKVTNVYKVAYLKHFIKQKRLRRAHKQDLLKKRKENTIKLLQDWQKSLNMVTNKLSILNMESRNEVASQEAMGDFSKPNLRESSGSDSDLPNSSTDLSYEEYNLSWTHNPYRSFYNFEDSPESALSQMDPPDFEVKYPLHVFHQNDIGPAKLSVLPEETVSQMAIEEVRADDYLAKEVC